MDDMAPPSDTDDQHFHYASEEDLLSEFRKYMRDPNNVETAVNYLYQSLLDEAILGVVFDVHRAVRAGYTDIVEGAGEPHHHHQDSKEFEMMNAAPDYDIFGSNIAKKSVDCTCPNCDRMVSSQRFAPHLTKCMGMGRNSSRIASRRIANAREGTGNYFGANVSDDEDDADWSGDKKRKKMPAVRANGGKKNGKSSS